MIEMRMLESSDPDVASKAVIGAKELTLQFESNAKLSGFPFDFPNATMKNKDRKEDILGQLQDLGFADSDGAAQAVIDNRDIGIGIKIRLHKKSIGENSIVPTAAAIANAVEDAVGVRVADLPLTAEKIYRALSKGRGL